jgi:hypothetical protein
LLGIDASADMSNRFVVSSDVEILTHDNVAPETGKARKVINRVSEAKVASVLFQTDHSVEAEFGLFGDGAFGLTSSTDGI